MEVITAMTDSIKVEKSVPMAMRDGVLLRADIYRPADREKHPAILMRSPYDRGMTLDFNFLNLIETVMSGYALVVQNLRGTYDSGGAMGLGDVSLAGEGLDGYDSVEWVAEQPWCDGNVGTAGGSYLGLLQWITARENPPHLKAMAPWISGSGGVEPSRQNGIVNLAVALNWVLGRALEIAKWQKEAGKDVSNALEVLHRGNVMPEEVYNYLPLKDVPHFNFEGIREVWTSRILNSDRETFEFAEKTRTHYEKVMVPCFHVSGWFDFYPSGTLGHFLSMKEKGGSTLARQNQHILMGPWLHTGPGVGNGVGDMGFGELATPQGSQLSQYNITFFNKYVRGMDVDLPAVRYFVMGRNIWRNADSWPLPQTRWQRYFLHSQGSANSSAGNGGLSQEEPKTETPDVFFYDPHNPVPTLGCRGGVELLRVPPGIQEQSPNEKRQDVLCYTTSELKEDLEVTGPLKVHLFAATSARDTDFVAKLVDVYPDGRAYNVTTDGIIRARYRKSLFEPEMVSPGEVNEYVINLEATSQLFRRGHRIRIDITSSSFPEYDRNMNTGNPIGEDAKGVTAKQTIYHDSEYPSYIDLPVITDRD
jgi:putative CocE/NonD family hydrolase